MRLDDAATSPLLAYLDAHNEMSQLIKVLTVGLFELEAKAKDAGSAKYFQNAIAEIEEPWGKGVTLGDAAALAQSGKLLVPGWALGHVFATIDSLKGDAEAEQDSLGTRTNIVEKAPTGDREVDSSTSDEDFLGKRGWLPFDADLLRLLQYFRVIRNCFAHRGGRASAFLQSLGEDKKLSSAEAALGTRKKKDGSRAAPPLLPRYRDGELIALAPRFVIYASHVGLQYAIHINGRLVSEAGLGGLVKMAARHGLLNASSTPGAQDGEPGDAVAAIHLALTWMRIRDLDPGETRGVLKDIGLLEKCEKQFSLRRPRAG